MMRRWGWATLLLASAHVSALDASSVDRERFCFDACRFSFKAVRFHNPENVTDPLMNECVNRLRLESLYLCVDTSCSVSSRDDGLGALNDTCHDLGVSIPGLDLITKFKNGDASVLTRFNATNPGREHVLESPALPTDAFLDIWMATLVGL